MANVATFLVSDLEGPPETEVEGGNLPLRESKYTVPLLWLVLFGVDDVHSYVDPDDAVDVPYLMTTTAEARRLYEVRRPLLRKLLANIEEHTSEWERTLDAIRHRYVKVDLDQILEMTDDGPGLLEPALSFFEAPTEDGLVALMRLTDYPLVLGEGLRSVVDRRLDGGKTTGDILFGSEAS